MRRIVMMATIVGAGALGTGAATGQVPTNPYAYTCGNYMAAQSGERGQANAMLFWSTGYLQGRLGAMPSTSFNADNFEQALKDVHAAILRICPNVPDMPLAEFMDNFAGDFERTAKPLQ